MQFSICNALYICYLPSPFNPLADQSAEGGVLARRPTKVGARSWLSSLRLLKLQELGRQLYCRPGFDWRDGSTTSVPTLVGLPTFISRHSIKDEKSGQRNK